MKRRIMLYAIGGALMGRFARARTPVIGGPCENCDWVFAGTPDLLEPRTRIAPPGEPGEPLSLSGTVYTAAGEPAPGIIVYAYHTDANGLYPKGKNRHGRLKGWTATNSAGQYRFDTIRPGAYPSRDTPQHIHMHVIEPGKGTYYIDSVTFTDDPLWQMKTVDQKPEARGGPGECTPVRIREGPWLATRDIALGKNIPGY